MLNYSANGPSGYNLTNSLRFRSSASAYLNRTPSVAGNRTTFTFSAWVKRGSLGIVGTLLSGGATGGTGTAQFIGFDTNDTFFFSNFNVGNLQTTQVFRDPSAWYHFVIAVDTTQATAANRIKMYVNGNQITAFSSSTYPSQNTNLYINTNEIQAIGRASWTSLYPFDGYMDEINFIDGQALTPSSFGSTNATTGVWQPARYTGTYGTNGFYLNFTDIALTSGSNTGLGRDFSGNGNFWNTNNISVTSGVTYDAMSDVPTLTSATVANYCTANPLDASPSGTSVISNANLTVNVSGSGAGGGFGGQARCNTINFTNVSGKWYWEAFIDNAGTGAATLRLTFFMAAEPINISGQGGPYTWFWRADGVTDLTSPGTFATNDVVMFAYDSDSGKLWVGKNGTWSNSGVPAAGTGQVRTITALAAYALGLNYGTSGGGTGTASFNFGQRPFAYTPPTGYNRLNTFNLPTSAVVKGNSVMDATLYTGNGSTQTITNAGGFRPDLVWQKSRSSGTAWHNWIDVVRGVGNRLFSNSTDAESFASNSLTSFNSNGFSIGSATDWNTNGSSNVAWQWQAGSSTVTNTSGSISAQVRANTTAGFSIVTYTGTGANATVGHGLGVAPRMIIAKGRTNVDNWPVGTSVLGWDRHLLLNSSAAAAVTSSTWNNTAPTSTVFSIGTDTRINQNTIGYVAYCWAAIPGYSAFGSYTGNANASGPFIYCGFQPKFIMFKRTDAIENWGIWTPLANGNGIASSNNFMLFPNLANAQDTTQIFDTLANGFKNRDSGSLANANGGTYIYMAFAENPFKNSLAR